VATLRQDVVEPQDDVPGASVDRTGQVAWGGVCQPDGEFGAVAPAPAPEAVASEYRSAARIEHPDVHDVAAAFRQRSTDPIGVGVMNGQPTDPGWHLKRDEKVIVRCFICWGNEACQCTG